jgi:hypothetical protein
VEPTQSIAVNETIDMDAEPETVAQLPEEVGCPSPVFQLVMGLRAHAWPCCAGGWRRRLAWQGGG